MVTCEALLLTFCMAVPGETVLLDFSASWCGPCRAMEPTVERLVAGGYPVRKIDIDQDRQLASQYRVTGVPCFVLLQNGREVDRSVGAVSYARLVQMFDKARTGSNSDAPVVRSQSPDRPRPLAALARTDARDNAAPSRWPSREPSRSPQSSHQQAPGANPSKTLASQSALASPTEQAMDATVRLRVADQNGHGCGTGTIIDTHGNEALIVTCGHIFRDTAGRGSVEVDLFVDGQKRTVAGDVLSYNLERDIGLVTISPGMPVTAARVAPGGYQFELGSSVFSIGCDRGADPSIRTSRITAVDKYLGPPNIEVAGQPVQGRSGGGLFSQEGLLIGICNAADPQEDEGIYASLPTIHWELDRVGQRRVYDATRQDQLAGLVNPRRVPAADRDQTTPPPQMSREMPDMMPLPPADRLASVRNSGDTEVICIIRSKANREAQERVVILNNPSADLLRRLEQASQPGLPAAAIAGRTPGVPNGALRDDGSSVIRAQSSDR